MSQPSSLPGVVHPQQPPVAAAGLRADTGERRYPIEFTATAGEYFRIWIVNLALTIVTLGIYSAWAKVRKRRYFYGHTRIDGEGFEYRARPIAILKGRLIAFALFAVFYGVGYYSPLYQLALWIPLMALAPWLIVRSLAFNAYNSAYRNVRLRFDGAYKDCARLLIGYALLMAVTLGLAFPFFKRRLVRFVTEHHSYGTTRFALASTFARAFVKPYFVAWGAGVLLGLAMVGFFVAAGIATRGSPRGAETGFVALVPLGILLFYAGLFLLFAYVRARASNAIWNNLAVGPLRFTCAMRARDMVWLYFSNALAVVFSLGLASPWAVVRMARYRASKMTAIATGPLGDYVQAESRDVSAAGEEVAEMFDVDVAL
jgi:uncharacterized membrane protein YjgN (DUF898 family)